MRKTLVFLLFIFLCCEKKQPSKPKYVMEGKIEKVEYLQGSKRSDPATIIHFDKNRKIALRYYQNITFTNKYVYIYRKEGYIGGCGYVIMLKPMEDKE